MTAMVMMVAKSLVCVVQPPGAWMVVHACV